MDKKVSLGGALLVLVYIVVMCCGVPEGAFASSADRVYELVSPIYKGGYGVAPEGILAVAPTGERVVFWSLGAFAGAPAGATEAGYIASRGTAGWSTAPLIPPAVIEPLYLAVDFSPTLELSLTFTASGTNRGAAQYEGTGMMFLLHDIEAPDVQASFEVAGDLTLEGLSKEALETDGGYQGASADFCHILFYTFHPLLPEGPPPGASGLYELDRGCEGNRPSLRLVSVNNASELKAISAHCGVEAGLGQSYNGQITNLVNAVADGGNEIFFTANVEPGAAPACETGVYQLFVRMGGSRTLEVSRAVEASKPYGGCEREGVPGEVPCDGAAGHASANFAGASEPDANGNIKAFFTTAQSLVGGDTDKENDLYMATIGCPSGNECNQAQKEVTSLVQVSRDSVSSEAADVQGVLKIAPNGSRVYFVAHGTLSESANTQGEMPVKGADNLYVYNTTSGRTSFIVDLCTAPGESGDAKDIQCPLELGREGTGIDARLWEDGGEAQTAGENGEFLVFSSYGQLVADDTNTVKDVYRYDAETGELDRVSLGEEGFDANGDDGMFDASIAGSQNGGATVHQQHEMNNRAISEDGSRIVFRTARALSPRAVNGLQNVYEWHKEPGWSEGIVSLISSGSAEEPDTQVVIAPSGRDIFFVTSAGLASQDMDGAPDVYDARIEGGFPSIPAERQPCSGDACQGPLANPAPLLVPGSVSQASGEDFAPPKPTSQTKKVKPKKAKRKKRKVHTKARKIVKSLRRSGR